MAQQHARQEPQQLTLTIRHVPRALVARLQLIAAESGDAFGDVVIDALALHADACESGGGR